MNGCAVSNAEASNRSTIVGHLCSWSSLRRRLNSSLNQRRQVFFLGTWINAKGAHGLRSLLLRSINAKNAAVPLRNLSGACIPPEIEKRLAAELEETEGRVAVDIRTHDPRSVRPLMRTAIRTEMKWFPQEPQRPLGIHSGAIRR